MVARIPEFDDPDSALQEIRNILDKFFNGGEAAYAHSPNTWRMMYLVARMDEWLSTGGMIPIDWCQQKVKV